MNVILKKQIPWQNREVLGGTKAFFMTLFEALSRPIDYFEKLQVREDYHEPQIFIFYNSLYLTGPLIPQMLFVVPFLTVIAIVVMTPVIILGLALLFQKSLALLGESATFKANFYILAFSSPAFILAYVPVVGYWFAAVAFTFLVGIGFTIVHKLDFAKILSALIFVPLVVLIPFGAVRFAQNWQTLHPAVDTEWEAQKVLAALAVAAENYALKNDGHYPMDSSGLLNGAEKFIVRDYCGETLNNYTFYCDFRGFGYYLKAQPQGWRGRGKKVFYVTTGGKLREARK